MEHLKLVPYVLLSNKGAFKAMDMMDVTEYFNTLNLSNEDKLKLCLEYLDKMNWERKLEFAAFVEESTNRANTFTKE